MNAAILSHESLAVAIEIMGGQDEIDVGADMRFVNHPKYYAVDSARAAYFGADHPTVAADGWVSTEENFFLLDHVRYLFVVKTIEYVKPEVVSLGDQAEFVPGKIEAQAILCDLDAKQILGGFVFSATNSDNVEVFNYTDATSAQEALRGNLEAYATRALEGALVENFPNGTFPDIWRSND